MAPTLSKKLRIHAECRWRRSGDCHLNFFELLQRLFYTRTRWGRAREVDTLLASFERARRVRLASANMYCDRHGCGSPDGIVDRSARLDSLRCRADSRGRLVAQRPCIKTDPARKRFDLVIAAITRHTPAELLRMDEFNNLRKNSFSREHASRIRDPASSRSHPFLTRKSLSLKA
jgi:hypothetical protein